MVRKAESYCFYFLCLMAKNTHAGVNNLLGWVFNGEEGRKLLTSISSMFNGKGIPMPLR